MKRRIALVGNPNCGKTTLFNALTGSKQKVGNWPGVTVERKSAQLCVNSCELDIVDLPGIYNLSLATSQQPLDQTIASQYLFKRDFDLIINVVDASNLERNLYLTSQLVELGVPVIIVLNMIDIARARQLRIQQALLAQEFACPVIEMIASKNEGLKALKQMLCDSSLRPAQAVIEYPSRLTTAHDRVAAALATTDNQWAHSAATAQALLLGSEHSLFSALTHPQRVAQDERVQVQAALDEDLDIIIADRRYGFIHDLSQRVCQKGSTKQVTLTQRIDRIVLNRWLAIPIFLAVMYSLFVFAINFAGVFQDLFDILSDAVFVQAVSHYLTAWHWPNWLVALLANGVGRGINTTLTFTPIIAGMFFFLALLESCGYMARAAFVMDRLMRALGLPGKAFVPLIVGFGCNVPAIMATRTLDDQRERVLTILMSPFMSCGARLAIFALFTTAFFPTGGQNVVFALYLIGILVAVFTGFMLRKTLLLGEPAPFIMELPPYHLPRLKSVLFSTWTRLKRFLTRAGKVIIPVCLLIGSLNAISLTGELHSGAASQDSLLSALGRMLTPLFAPMGLTADNWPATVGLLTGSLAKEVVVATLNSLYSHLGQLHSAAIGQFDFFGSVGEAFSSIKANLINLPSSLGNPILASAPDHGVNQAVYGVMYQRFAGQAGAFAYLLFVLLYVPCVSTVAVIARELNYRLAAFSVAWSLAVAYIVAAGFYQLATVRLHVVSSVLWLGLFSLLIVSTFALLKRSKVLQPCYSSV